MDVKRGEIYWVDWNPGRGSELTGLRPALIIQNDIGNRLSITTIVAALTTVTKKSYPFLVRVTAKESGIPEDSRVNLAAIMTIDKSRVLHKCGQLIVEKMSEVDTAIKASLGLQ